MLAGSQTKFAFCAPTNKAVKVLAAVTGEACTIYSLLNLRVDTSGELKTVVGGKAPDLSHIDVIVLDEASMVNANLFSILEDVCDDTGIKVVFMWDDAQLPPVKEAQSAVHAVPTSVSLTEVMRHDNQILELVTRIRQAMMSIAPSIDIKSDNAEGEGVWKLNKPTFKQHIYEKALEGGFADGAKGKVIAWRNKTVDEYNNLIRSAVYGADAVPGYYLVGDRIVAAAPCKRGEVVVMTTDEEALVEKVTPCKHPLAPEYQGLELLCRTETNKTVRLLVLHPESKNSFERDCEALAAEARANGRMWKKFWEKKDLFHDARYAYAITAHRSQGSTYENVWVDFQDILMNRNRKEAFQCLYVACSRPTTRLVLG